MHYVISKLIHLSKFGHEEPHARQKIILMFGTKLCSILMDFGYNERPESLAKLERHSEMCGLVFQLTFH